MKYRYRIDGGRYGGEVVVGRISQEFVVENQDLAEDDLWDAICELEEQSGNYWSEFDDIEHHFGAYSDGGFIVTDITNEEDPYVWNESEQKYEGALHLYDREAYTTQAQDRVKIPVVTIHSAEKGSFGSWFLETEEEFQIEKLAFSTLATDVCELVENVFYDRVYLETDFDYADTNGKGMSCHLGEMVEEWHDKPYTEEQIADRFQEVMDD
jgi:hypothetical protein